jgi:hypothetical protein
MSNLINKTLEVLESTETSNVFTEISNVVVEEEFYMSEEDYNNLSEEEKTKCELVEEDEEDYAKNPYDRIKDKVYKAPKTFRGAVKSYMLHSGNKDKRYDADSKQVAIARKNMKIAKKSIKKMGGDMKKVDDKAEKFTYKHNA